MKKVKYLIVSLFLVLLTGCSSYNMSMSINKNKTMDLSINIISSSKDEISNYVNTLKEKYENNDFKVEEFTKDNNYGISISKHYDNIDNNSFAERTDKFDLLYLYNNDYDKTIETKIFNVDKGFSTNRYAANFFVDLSNIDIDFSNTNVIFSVNLPKGSISNNAYSVSEDGNTLTWNITNKGRTDIEFVFEVNSYDTIYFIVAIIIAIFLVFSIISAILSKSGDVSSSDIDRDIELLSNNAKYNNVNNKSNNNGVYSNYMNNRNNNNNNNKTINKPELVKLNNNENDMNNLMSNVSVVKNDNLNNNFNVNTNQSNMNNDIFNYPKDNNIINNNVSNNINNNPDLNINKSVDMVNSFNYEEPVDNKKVEEEVINNYDPDIIRVNNKEVVVTKENKEDE